MRPVAAPEKEVRRRKTAGAVRQMQISNIQENLTKTELIQRLQQIMQDAARASQDVQTPQSLERTRIAQEEVENTEESKNEGIHKDGAKRKARSKKRKKSGQDETQDASEERGSEQSKSSRRPNDGHILDVTV